MMQTGSGAAFGFMNESCNSVFKKANGYVNTLIPGLSNSPSLRKSSWFVTSDYLNTPASCGACQALRSLVFDDYRVDVVSDRGTNAGVARMINRNVSCGRSGAVSRAVTVTSAAVEAGVHLAATVSRNRVLSSIAGNVVGILMRATTGINHDRSVATSLPGIVFDGACHELVTVACAKRKTTNRYEFPVGWPAEDWDWMVFGLGWIDIGREWPVKLLGRTDRLATGEDQRKEKKWEEYGSIHGRCASDA